MLLIAMLFFIYAIIGMQVFNTSLLSLFNIPRFIAFNRTRIISGTTHLLMEPEMVIKIQHGKGKQK